MTHLMSDLRHRVVVRRDLSVRGPLGELMRIGPDIMGVRFVETVGWILLHLVSADIDGLDELPLKATLGAISGEVSLVSADAGDRAACRTTAERPGTGGSSLRVVDTEIGVVRQHIELVAQGIDD